MRSVLAMLAAGAGVLLAPAAASAGQIVYRHVGSPGGDDLRVMNEDGSGQRVWLRAYEDVPASGGTRFVTLFSPQISSDGPRVLFTSQTLSNKEPGGLALGLFSQGVNLWEAGAVRRLSPPPQRSDGLSSFESDASAAADGRIYYASTGGSYSGTKFNGSFGMLSIFGPDGSDQGRFAAACEGIGLGTGSGPKPSPVDPGLVAYGGCSDRDTGQDVIYVGRNGGADQRVVRTAPASTDGYASAAESPAWRPDGQRLVSIEAAGQGPSSIVTYAPDGSAPQTVLTAPVGVEIGGAQYVGGDRIVFDAATPIGDGFSRDVHLVRATCTGCALGDTARLTTDGASDRPSWSPAGLVTPVSPPSAPPSAPTPPTPSPTAPSPTAPALAAVRALAAKQGIALRLTLRRGAKVTGTKPKRKARRSTLTLKAGTRTVRLRKVGGVRVRPGSYRVKAIPVGASAGRSVTVRVKR